MEFKKNSQEVFRNAINNCILSSNPSKPNYAGNFMYMHSQDNIDYFKHKLTRRYGYDKESIKNALIL